MPSWSSAAFEPHPHRRQGPRLSRAARWRNATSDATEALERLKDLQSEYQSWRDNIPESLQDTPVVEKLDAILEVDVDAVAAAVEELNDVEFPRGFGRD